MHVQHLFDVMHIVKNIAEAVLKYVFGEIDNAESRRA